VGKRYVGSTYGFVTSLEVGPDYRYPTEQVPPHIGLSPRQGRGTTTFPTMSDPASLLERALALLRVPRFWILSPCSGGLRRCHVSHGSGSCLPAWEGSGATTCPAAPNPASLLKRVLVLPHIPRLWILPPCSGGLRRCHASRGSGSCLPTQEGSGAATRPTAPDPASLLRRALVLPHIPWLRILPLYSKGLRCYHMSRGSGSCLPARVGSGAAMCSMALDPTSLLRRAPVLPCVPRYHTLPPYLGGLRCYHVSRCSLWATYLKNKEMLSWPTYAARLTCFQDMPAHYRDA
jgi:hypothetical protein